MYNTIWPAKKNYTQSDKSKHASGSGFKISSVSRDGKFKYDAVSKKKI